MRAVDIIEKKRNGETLKEEEVRFLVKGFTQGTVSPAQMASWAMAVYFRGLDAKETLHLTMALVDSGERLDLTSIPGVKVDKHSTGGVGDKTTLVLAPLVASAGVPVAKLSGRGLGHTGGTMDKLEAIPGFRGELGEDEFIRQVKNLGVAVASTTARLVPADKKLYALRDITATVDSPALIAASVMSKKIASGADAIVLDVKAGSGAFMQGLEEARDLAARMVAIGSGVGLKTVALVTAMDQPLGKTVGNALELREAIDTLAGRGPQDLRRLVLELGSRMLVLAGVEKGLAAAYERLAELLSRGEALETFKRMVVAQGGDPKTVMEPRRLPSAPFTSPVPSPEDGFVVAIDTASLGRAAMVLGAGRSREGEKVDPAVGLVVEKKIGDRVTAGEPLALIHARNHDDAQAAAAMVTAAYTLKDQAGKPFPLIMAEVAP